MVLQRTTSNQSRARFSGTCQATGAVEASVRANGRTLPGWNWKRVGAANGRTFAGQLTGLKTGGPYDVSLRIRTRGSVIEETSATDVLVGDVWVLAGQSNMEGIGWLKDKLPAHKLVRAFYQTDEWDEAVDPLHTLWCAVDPVHNGNPMLSRKLATQHTGVGPGVSFGQALQRHTGVPQGLLACAHGGTSMSQWDPKLKEKGGHSFYGAMCRRVRKNGGAVAGVFWYQGCSDTSPETAVCYTPRMIKLVQAMRRDFHNSRLPIVMVQIGRFDQHGGSDSWDSVREQQRRLPAVIPRLTVVPSIDLPMDDGIHISGAGQNLLGRRAAEALNVLREGRKAGLPPIDVRDIRLKPNPISRRADLIVRFANLKGALTSYGQPTGFTLKGFSQRPYRTELQGDSAILHVNCTPDQFFGQVGYGLGFDPHCNITDSDGRAIPAFGPLPFLHPMARALSPFITNLRVSSILPGCDIRKLKTPANLELQPRQFPGNFCDRHLEIIPAGEALVYYAFAFTCPIRMKLQLLLGYDGPLKLWLDRKELFCDPKGTNPALPEDAKIPFTAKTGKHEIVIALGSHGAAWGVFLRLERLGVPLATLRKNLANVAMPEIQG